MYSLSRNDYELTMMTSTHAYPALLIIIEAMRRAQLLSTDYPITKMIGDTIKIYSETFFDCGMNSKVVKDSISVIIE